MMSNPLAPSPARRLLYVYSGKARPGAGGLDLVVRQQVQALAEAGHQITFLSRGAFDHPQVRNITVPVTPANLISFLPSRYYYLAQHRFFARLGSWLIPWHAWDGVISWPKQSYALFRAARARGMTCFLNCPDWHYNVHPWRDHAWPGIRHRLLEEEYTLAHRLLTASDHAATSFLENGIPGEKIRTIGRAADIHRFVERPRDLHPFRVVMFGRVSERKGIFQLLEAWRRAALVDAELWIIGAVPGEIKPEVMAALPENARLFGHRDDAETLLPQCHVQVLLTRMEGMAKSLVEGAACGLVTLTTRESGFPLMEGETGYWVARDDVDRTAALLQALARDPVLWQAMSKKSALFVREHLSWEGFRSRFKQAIAEGLNDSQPQHTSL